jgi:hypothetical protein
MVGTSYDESLEAGFEEARRMEVSERIDSWHAVISSLDIQVVMTAREVI